MSDQPAKKIFKLALLSRVFSFVRPYRFIFLGNLVLAIALAFATPIRPYIIQVTVNTAIGKSVVLPSWLHWVFPNMLFHPPFNLFWP
jgi:ATP-binding cassette subfamily B protein